MTAGRLRSKSKSDKQVDWSSSFLIAAPGLADLVEFIKYTEGERNECRSFSYVVTGR